MKKLILTFCMILVALVSYSADLIDQGETKETVEAVGTVIDSLDVIPVVGYENLDMGVMEAEMDTTVYRTSDTNRGGNPHPAKIEITGAAYNSVGAKINVYITDNEDGTDADQVTISNGSSDIIVNLTYTDTSDDSNLTSLLALDLDSQGELGITIDGAVDTTTGAIPSTVGLYQGTIYVRVNYDSSTPWF